jgi:hypothetical protein
LKSDHCFPVHYGATNDAGPRLSGNAYYGAAAVALPASIGADADSQLNSLQAIALGAGVSLKAKLRRRKGAEQLLELSVSAAHQEQREEWLTVIDQLNNCIDRKTLKSMLLDSPALRSTRWPSDWVTKHSRTVNRCY